MIYFETSAKDNTNLDEAFYKAEQLVSKQLSLTEETFEPIIMDYLKLKNNKEIK